MTTLTVRRWVAGRIGVTATQKAGAEGMVRNNGSDRDRGRIRIVSVSVGDRTNLHRYTTIAGGTPALQTSQRPLSRPRFADDRTNPHRHSPGTRDAVCCSGYEAGRRRAIGVVAALPINPRATTPMVRRWVAGTPKRHVGPEGR